MPELPEVERAAGLIRSVAKGKKIVQVETVEDTIVYNGITNEEFLTGRTLLETGRYGKLFYLLLDGEGRMPVLHLGMTGMLQIRGEEAVYYRKKPKQDQADWPPRFMKFIIHFQSEDQTENVQIAFLDPRRLGRVRLCQDPHKEPPISTLGFDPILCMASLEEFQEKVLKRSCPIKALLLDQSFSAGVGNWIADEVLFHAAIHPEQVAKTLTPEQMASLHHNIVYVCQTAVDVNADSEKFPSHWLFGHRWGKGKTKPSLILPSGEKASIKWITVGGRTSAVVQQVQKLQNGSGSPEKEKPKKQQKKRPRTKKQDSDSDLSEPPSEEDDEDFDHIESKPTPKRRRTDPGPSPRKRLSRSGLSQVTTELKLE
ncbi:hypothetical protein CPB86DRAFT_772765 [Serendipita vermifera]|nr:hypothetical protein CPB86DRAFT_772765 [Serendipita vermifera]